MSCGVFSVFVSAIVQHVVDTRLFLMECHSYQFCSPFVEEEEEKKEEKFCVPVS